MVQYYVNEGTLAFFKQVMCHCCLLSLHQHHRCTL